MSLKATWEAFIADSNGRWKHFSRYLHIHPFHAFYILSFFCRESTAQSFKRKSDPSIAFFSWILRLAFTHTEYGVVSVWRRSRKFSISDIFLSEQKELFHHITYIVFDLGNRWWDPALIIIIRWMAYCLLRFWNRWEIFEVELRLDAN